jgi:uncharacterized membrane protein
MRVVGSVDIDRPAGQVWAYVADYGNDPRWRAGVTQMHPSQPGPAQEGVTTHERLQLLGMTFRTDATIDRVEPGHRLWWRAHDRQKRLEGSRLVEPTGSGSCRFTEVVEGRLLGPLRPLGPLVAWLLRRRATADLSRLKHLLERSTVSGSAPEEPTTRG